MKNFVFSRRLAQSLAGKAMAVLLSVGLLACGGGGGAGDSVFNPNPGTPTTPVTVTDLAVSADKPSVPNTGAEAVTFTITALTTGNAAVTGVEVPVTVEVDSGAIVTASAKVTNKETGKLTAVVQILDKTSRTVKLSVSSGTIKKTASFDVVDSVTGSKVSDLAMVLDRQTVPSDGSQLVKLTVTSLDNARVAIGGSPVKLEVIDSVNPGGAIVNSFGKSATDVSNGQLTAEISLVKKNVNRQITVQATSGTVVRTISFDAVEAVSVIPKASDLSMTLSRATVGNAGSEEVDVVVTAVDAARNAISGIKVTFSVDSNAVLVPGNLSTDAKGQAKATVLVGADRSNRTVTVTATSETLVRRAAFKVTGAKLQAQLLPATLRRGEPGAVEYTLTDVNSNPMIGVDVTVNGPGAASKSGKTDGRGKYNYSYIADGGGPTQISAEAGGAAVSSTVQIDAQVDKVPDDTRIASATFTASPVVVSVNPLGSTENRSELRLLFRTDKNEPIPNVRVRIGLGPNNSGTDGRISSGNDKIITSDASGVAITSFVPGQRPSPTDQVMVYACFAKTDEVPEFGKCPIDQQRSISLTVVEQPVSISIGTNALIGTGANKLTYYTEFTVLVVDTAGNPKSDVQVSPFIDLPSYLKGRYGWNATLRQWVQIPSILCLAEDSDVKGGFRNGTIETGEDLNGNKQLDPRKSDVSITMVGSTRTDANGMAVMRIEYPQNYGSWVEYAIRVSASGVVSPPAFFGRIAREGVPLDRLTGPPHFTGVPIETIKNEGSPPFIVSPYGEVGSCQSPD